MTRYIDIEIDELIVEGADAGDGRALADALRAEIARLVAEGGAPAWIEARGSSLRVSPRMEVPRGASAGQIGAHIARALYRGAL